MNNRVAELRKTLIDTAGAPGDAPWGMPGRFYVDPDYYAHEYETVLHKGWHCVCRSDELPQPGDFLTLELLGEPIIVVRDTAEMKAFANVCRHRGMRLVDGAGSTKRFTCSYHAWMYGTDGVLQRAGRMKNASFDPKTCKLAEFSCVERFGFVYISLSEAPPDIDEELEGLAALIAPYEPENYRIVHSAVEVWQTNWKCLVENFMEGYHLSVVHPQTLHSYTPTGLSRKGPSGRGFTSYFANYPDDIDSRGRGAKCLSEEDRNRSTLFAVFPTQVVSIAATLLVSLSIRPIGAEAIEVRWTMSNHNNELDAETIAQRISLWTEVNREDREKLEAMQTSLRSVHANGGPLAEPDYEGTIHDFMLWLAKEEEAYLS